ncbi:MAG: lysophospholipid transporter LplT [Burkholderiaceae bacterium]
MPASFYLVIASHFVSAFADNALLLIAIARLIELGLPGWWAPLLKFWFTISYVLLAPWIGPLADAIPKARLMASMNGLKFVGAALLLLGVQPLIAFGIVGVAAAGYAPAKYGIVTELLPEDRLVAANAWTEVTVVCAVLGGTVAGGVLVSSWFVHLPASEWAQSIVSLIDQSPTALALPIGVLLILYALGVAFSLGVRAISTHYVKTWASPAAMLRDFFAANRLLWRDRQGGVSLAVTTLFWGAGATLQFIVLRWAQETLKVPLDQAAYLQGLVAAGVTIGAALAGRWIRLANTLRVLPLGVAMGLLVLGMAWVDTLPIAIPLLALIGAFAGFFLVPMNALLQHRGYQLITPGRAVAVQGCNENLSVLLMLAVYAAMVAADVPLNMLLWGFGLVISATMGLLMLRERLHIIENVASLNDSPR